MVSREDKEVMKLKGLVPLAAAGAAVALIAGCSPAPGTAAQVEDRTISLAALDETIESCIAAGAAWEGAPKRDILASMTLVQSAYVIAEEHGFDITRQDAEVVVNSGQSAQAVDDHPACAEYEIDGAFLTLVLWELDTPEYLAELAELDVEVNPRFGEWFVNPQDPSNPYGIGGSGSLSVLSPTGE